MRSKVVFFNNSTRERGNLAILYGNLAYPLFSLELNYHQQEDWVNIGSTG